MTKAQLFHNGHPHQYHFDGGYISFSADTVDGFHYYIQDYMGNNRMVVNGRTDSIEQITHYYPYGGVIGDICTNESLQPYKFEGKVLAAVEKIDNLRREDEALAEGKDRTFGLDNYDIEARQYFAMAPMWDRVDPLAEKYYGISPYVYCGGDPVNCIDPDGRVVIKSNDARYIKACMSLTPTGQAVWNAMDATPYPISIIISNGTYNSNHPDGKSSSKNPLAVTNVTTIGVVDK